MKKIYKFTQTILFTLSFVFMPITFCSPAFAAISNSTNYACNGVGLDSNACGATNGTSIDSVLTTVLDVLSWIVGVAALIMVIISGFRYIVSGGDEAGVRGAKNSLIYIVVGIVIVAAAQIIVQFVIHKSTS